MNKRLIAGAAVGAVAAVSALALMQTASERQVASPNRIVVVPTASTPPAPSVTTPNRVGQAVTPREAWHPALADTWQWQLTGKINTRYDVKVYDIDLFDTPDAVMAQLHADGRRIVCYFSAGSAEKYRPDYDQFHKSDLGKPLDGYPDERWIDVRSRNVRRIMLARLDLAQTRGCDGVEPDNVDGYANKNGLGLTPDDQLDYNRFIASESRKRGLAVGLKNDLAQVKTLEPDYDFAVNEQCHQYRECDRLQPFTAARKPVFNAEYKAKYRDNVDGARDQLCRDSRAADIRTLVLSIKLNDSYRYSCD